MYWGFGEKNKNRGTLATDVSSGPIFLTKKKKKNPLGSVYKRWCPAVINCLQQAQLVGISPDKNHFHYYQLSAIRVVKQLRDNERQK